MPRARKPVFPANLGLYLGIPEIQVPIGGLVDGLNFRVTRLGLSNLNMGWQPNTRQNLLSPVTSVETFINENETVETLAGTLTDLFIWEAANSRWRYLTERYEVGTASASGTAVTGVGTSWSTASPPVRAGDEISFGAIGRRDISDLWYKIASVGGDTTLTLDENVGTIGSGAYTIRQKFQSASIENFWRFVEFPRSDVGAVIKHRAYLTNGGIDAIVRYEEAGTQVERVHLGAGGFKCKELRRFKNLLLYLNIVENSGSSPNKQQSFKNSDAGLPETMVGGIAGEFVAAPGTSSIKTSLPIGDDMTIYTANELVNVTFVGAPDIWAFRTVVPDVGLVASRLAAPFAETHEFVGFDGLYVFNGIQAEIVDTHVWFHVLRSQDQNRIETSFNVFDEENAQLSWAVALTGDSGPTTPLNLLLYSEHFDAATWSKTNATVTANDAANPLITSLTNADKLLEDATASVEHGAHQDVTKDASAKTYTLSLYADPDTRTKLRVQLDDAAGNSARADFDIGAGTLIGTGTGGTGFTVVDTTITAVGSYQRVSLTATSNSATTIRETVRLLDAAGAVSYNGDGTSGMWVWGAQLTETTAPVEYIQSTVEARSAPTETAPQFAYENSYIVEVPEKAPSPYSVREFPFTVVGFFDRATELTWDQMTEAWTAYNFAWSDRFFSGAFPLLLAGDVLGRIHQLGTANHQDAVAYASFAQFSRRPVTDIRSRDMVTRVEPIVQRFGAATYSLIVTTSLYEQSDSNATVDVVSNFDLTLASDPWVSVFRVGRFMQVQFGTAGSASGEPWIVNGYDFQTKPGGKR